MTPERLDALHLVQRGTVTARQAGRFSSLKYTPANRTVAFVFLQKADLVVYDEEIERLVITDRGTKVLETM